MASSDKTINTDVPEKDVFALHFLQSLSNLRTQNPIDSPDKANDRVRKIKTAAYVSMAKAAGGSTKRLWIKALLRRAAKDNNKIKIVRFSRRSRKRVTTWQRRRVPVVERLRNLVPGGGEMETAKLMEETAHYIKCLSMQVKVMQCLVDGMSPK